MLSSPSMFNTPSAAQDLPPESAYIQPTLNHGLRIWWAYYWPTTVVTSFLTFCTAYWVRVFYQRAVISAQAAKILLAVSPYAITAATGLLVFRYILGKRFRDFRVALLPRVARSDATPLRPVWRRTVRVWWTFTWRSVVYTVLLSFLANVSLGIVTGMLSEMNRIMAVVVPIIQGLMIGAAVGLFVVYSNILDEEFGDFRVVLLPREAPAQNPMAASVPPQTQPSA
ncbi:MAG: hypothetical protein WAN10_14850 [Candidatus Acidiferrales bacterium]